MPAKFKVEGSINGSAVVLRWKPVRRAKAYAIEWLGKDQEFGPLSTLKGDEIVPGENGLIEHVDDCCEAMGPGGTYRVVAYFDPDWEGPFITSAPVAVGLRKPVTSMTTELSRRLGQTKLPKGIKALILRLNWSPYGWRMLLPKEAGECLGKRIEVEVRSQVLNDRVLDLLAAIFENLSKLAARAEKAFNDYFGGLAALDEGDRIDRPRIVIDESLSKSAGAWTMVIDIKGSDYGWHVEFVRSRFKRIWAGD